jgi:hypothetical protein
MRFLKYGCVSFLFVMTAVAGFAQSMPAAEDQTAPADSSTTTHAARRRYHHTLCWKQAGITPDMVNRRWKIEDNQKVEIATVCRDPKTNAQQKRDLIEQIHANTEQAIGQVIPSAELAKFNKCEAASPKTAPASAPGKELGPCGGVIPKDAADESHGMEHEKGAAPMN